MERPKLRPDSWYVIGTLKISTRCKYHRNISGCSHPSNTARPKKCTFENCPIAVDRMCKKAGKCMFLEKVNFESMVKIC